MGRFAILADPQGAAFAIYTPNLLDDESDPKAQVGEFSFLLAQQGRGLMTGDVFQMFINTSILTMLAAPFLIQAGPWLTARLPEIAPGAGEKKDYCALMGHTIIAGVALVCCCVRRDNS